MLGSSLLVTCLALFSFGQGLQHTFSAAVDSVAWKMGQMSAMVEIRGGRHEFLLTGETGVAWQAGWRKLIKARFGATMRQAPKMVDRRFALWFADGHNAAVERAIDEKYGRGSVQRALSELDHTWRETGAPPYSVPTH